MGHSRRSMLRRTGSVAGGLAALAGCLATDSSDESDPSDSESTPPDPPTASTPIDDLHTWLPAPAAFDTAGYPFFSYSPQSFLEYEEHLAPGATEGLADDGQAPAGTSMADASALHAVGRDVFVLEGVDVSAFEEEYEAQGLEQSGTYQEFAIYEGVGGSAAGLGDGALVMAPGSTLGDDNSDKLPIVEAILDARAGSATRYAEAKDDAAALVDALGTAHALAGRTHEPGTSLEGAVAEGSALHIGESESTVRAVTVFEAGEVDADAMSSWADDATTFYGADAETNTDGRTVVASATVPTGDIDSLPEDIPGPDIGQSDSSRGPPQALFDFTYESAGDGVGLLTITHDGGDSVQASQLSIQGGPFASVSDADQTSAGTWSGSKNDDDAVTAGDSVAVGVESGYDVRVVWQHEDEAVTLGRHEGLES